jgi:hypothetical protein
LAVTAELGEAMTDETAGHGAERKRMETIWWAGVLIWIGLALFGESLEILPEIGDDGEWWPWIFIGVGPWSLALNMYRAFTHWPAPSTWDWIWTAIFLLVALGTFVDIGGEIVGAVALVSIGIVLLVRALRHHERAERKDTREP